VQGKGERRAGAPEAHDDDVGIVHAKQGSTRLGFP
jgi:hypothetical protein